MERQNKATRTPSYRLHKASGQAVVTVRGTDVYLGAHGSPESIERYAEIVSRLQAERLVTSACRVQKVTVDELVLGYWKHCESYYKEPTLPSLRVALRRFRAKYGPLDVGEVGPRALKAYREAMIEEGLARPTINKAVGWIKSMYTWGSEEELLEAPIWQALLSVRGLKRGRSAARETDPVRPVPDDLVEATVPHLPSVVADMVRVQRLTGMRPSELCQMRVGELDTAGEVWTYTPTHHKTEHHGHSRVIAIGPRAQTILGLHLQVAMRLSKEGYVFSPRGLGAPSRKRRRPPGPCYDRTSYRRSIARACERAGLERWFPNQLRHARATEVRRDHGLDGSGAVLGHSKLETTQIYAERSEQIAIQIASQSG